MELDDLINIEYLDYTSNKMNFNICVSSRIFLQQHESLDISLFFCTIETIKICVKGSICQNSGCLMFYF